MLSKSAFSVGRALDTLNSVCGAGSEGITVTGVSEVFSAKVENPVQYFRLFAAFNKETNKTRLITNQSPVQKIQPEDYFDEKNEITIQHDPKTGKDVPVALPQQLASFFTLFGVYDGNGIPMNDKAKNVTIQWIEIPQSVSSIEASDAMLFGGQQLSKCPMGGNVLSKIAAASLDCVIESDSCDNPYVQKYMVSRSCWAVCSFQHYRLSTPVYYCITFSLCVVELCC